MNRRSFIRVLGLGAAATAVWPAGTAPEIVAAAGPAPVVVPWIYSGYVGTMLEQISLGTGIPVRILVADPEAP